MSPAPNQISCGKLFIRYTLATWFVLTEAWDSMTGTI